jgi:C4-type Zn-finger protein
MQIQLVLTCRPGNQRRRRHKEPQAQGAESKPASTLPAAPQVHEQEDLVRDVIKAESAAVRVPELDMELGIGTLGGLVTTVEVRRRRARVSGSRDETRESPACGRTWSRVCLTYVPRLGHRAGFVCSIN